MAGSQEFQDELEKAQNGSTSNEQDNSSLPRPQEKIATPASDATLSGALAPDNSIERSMNRINAYSANNDAKQDKYIGRGYVAAQVAVDQAEKNAYVDPAALDKRAMERPKFHRDQSTIKNSEIFGDISGMEGPTWNSAQPSEEVEIPDFQKMYEKYTKF